MNECIMKLLKLVKDIFWDLGYIWRLGILAIEIRETFSALSYVDFYVTTQG